MPKLKTRIIDLAAAARVSPATVDRVLNGRGGVSERAQSRVLEAAKRLKLNRVIETPPARWLNVPILMQSPTIHFYKELARRFGDHEMAMRQLKVRSAVHTFESILPAEIAEQSSASPPGPMPSCLPPTTIRWCARPYAASVHAAR